MLLGPVWASAALVGHWTFDEASGPTVFDATANGNDGTINGATRVAGHVGSGALSFDGQNDIVNIPNDAALNFAGSSSMTVTAWVSAAGAPGGACCGTIVGQRTPGNWVLRDDRRSAGAEFEILVSPGWQGDGAGDGVPRTPLGEWHHIAAVVDGSQVRIYVDGSMGDSFSYTGPMAGAGTPTDIGGGSDGFFNGLIDDVQIYDSALADWQVKYVADNPGAVAPIPEPSTQLIWSLLAGLGVGLGWRRRK
jgi:hypothetical protein